MKLHHRIAQLFQTATGGLHPTDPVVADARRITLTPAEREESRQMLLAHMEQFPAAISPRGVLAWPWTSQRVAGLSCSGVLLLGFATTVAAQGALPGDRLYPVKLGVEEVRSHLSLTATAKAHWEAERAQKRLAEAEQLSAQGRLSAATSTQLAVAFHQNVEQANAAVQALDASEDAAGAAALTADLEVALAAHQTVLDQFSPQISVSPVTALIDAIKMEHERVAHQRANLETRLLASDAAPAQVEQKKSNANEQIRNAQTVVERASGKLNATAVTNAQKVLDDAKKSFADASEHQSQQDLSRAAELFQKSQRTAKESETTLKIEETLPVSSVPAAGLLPSPAPNATLTVAVATDHSEYHPKEAVRITIRATNPGDQSGTYTFSTSCPARFTIDSDIFWPTLCAQTVTTLTIDGHETREWTFEFHGPLTAGTHAVMGEVAGYGTATTQFTVIGTIEPAPKLPADQKESDTNSGDSFSVPEQHLDKAIKNIHGKVGL